MDYKNILSESEGGITTITVNRPDKLNALNIQTISEIGHAVLQAENANAIRGIIITGSGSKAFVAGADISEFADFSAQQGREMSENGHQVFNSIENLSKPVLAAVNGFALGGGCELAMACHLRIAAENAKFGQPEANLGIIPGYGGTQRLVKLIGTTKATELLLTGELINAAEALQYGLVNYVTSPEMLLEKSRELMKKIIIKSPLVLKQILHLVNARNEKCINGFDEEIKEFANCFNTGDFKEGTSAFLNKRKPEFSGK